MRLRWMRPGLAGALAAVALAGPIQAQQGTDDAVAPAVARQQAREIAQGDPSRWYQPLDTPKERLRNARKEIGAAFEEARRACRAGPAAARADCLHEARAIWRRDLEAARGEFSAGDR